MPYSKDHFDPFVLFFFSKDHFVWFSHKKTKDVNIKLKLKKKSRKKKNKNKKLFFKVILPLLYFFSILFSIQLKKNYPFFPDSKTPQLKNILWHKSGLW